MDFTFSTAGRIHFGVGAAAGLEQFVSALGRRVLLVTGAHPERTSHLLGSMEVVARIPLGHEPSLDDARSGVELARESGADVVVAIGGGAVLDLAKAVAVLAVSGTDPLDHVDVIGRGLPLVSSSLPVVAVPTTSGTGAEVTRNAVLTSPSDRLKVSLRADSMMPALAVVDPELTLGCPPEVTASSGMDALTQCLEPLVSWKASPLSDGFCRTGLEAASRGLRVAFDDGDDLAARTDMALCSLMGGLALANSGLGAVHGCAGVLGGVTGAPHGAICGALLPSVVAVNVDAMTRREPKNPALRRYREAARHLTGVDRIEALLEWLGETERVLELDGLADLGLDESQLDEVVAASQQANSMKGNPILLDAEELRFVLESSL